MRADHEYLLTPRLSLSRPTNADIDAIHGIHRTPQACAYNPSETLASRDSAEDLFRRWDEHWKRHGFGYWVVRWRGEEPVLGFCGLKLMRLGERTVLNLFYRLDPHAWGNGVGSEAATAAVGWAHTYVPNLSVIARVRPENVASSHVARRAGLRRAEYLDTRGDDGPEWVYIASLGGEGSLRPTSP
jgi:[ribosomal protein S5]-alanine N-acetyltransferase